MLFNSFSFLFRFLPVFLTAYYISSSKYRNVVLLVGSLIFYSLGQKEYMVFLLMTLFVNTAVILGLQAVRPPTGGIIKIKNGRKSPVIMVEDDGGTSRRKVRTGLERWLLAVCLIYDFGQLIFFKYLNIMDAIPLGISFFTFQAVALVVDVYRGDVKIPLSPLIISTYIAMFPHLVMGPIESFGEVSDALVSRRYIKPEEFEKGINYLILGLGAKVILADRIGILWNNICSIGYDVVSTPMAWLGAYAYTLELYFDFAGYSMMAVGIGHLLGFRLPDNFDLPYVSRSVTEFWRRWHITLGRWFRNYVYIPLGGNRHGLFRTLLNLTIVFILTSLWHGLGINFAIWGGLLIFFLLLERLFLGRLLERTRVVGHLYILILMPIIWMAFSIEDTNQLLLCYGKMLPFLGITGDRAVVMDTGGLLMEYISSSWKQLSAGALLLTPLPKSLFLRYGSSWWMRLIIIAIFCVSMYYMTISAGNPFLYFNF